MLSLRAHSTRELRRKLSEKGFEKAVADRVVRKMTDYGYLDDEAFARDYARHLARNRHYGNRRIEMSLAEKGIARGIIAEALEETRKDTPEREGLEKVLEKKLKGRTPGGLDGREKRKLALSLAQRGYPWPLIVKALGKIEEGRSDDIE